MVECIWKKRNTRVRKHNLRCAMCCVNYIHGKNVYGKKRNTRVRNITLGVRKITNGVVRMLRSISSWHMHY